MERISKTLDSKMHRIDSKYMGLCYKLRCPNCRKKIYITEYDSRCRKYTHKNCGYAMSFSDDKKMAQ